MAQGKGRDIRQELADKFIKTLEDSVASGKPLDWIKPFIDSEAPYNALTGARYKGSNRFFLSGEADPRYVTFNQALQLDNADGTGKCHIRKGAKSVLAIKWVEVRERGAGEEGQGEERGAGEEGRKILRPVGISLFNAKDVEGMPPLERAATFTDFERGENIAAGLVQKTGLKIVHHPGGAFYHPSKDMVSMPPKDAFRDVDSYYHTLFHELAHSTGHPSRMDRAEGMAGRFGDPAYAGEEGVADISAAILCAETGISRNCSEVIDKKNLEQTAAYVAGWIPTLKRDKNEVFWVFAKAERVADYMLDRELGREAIRAAEKAQIQAMREQNEKQAAERAAEKPARTSERKPARTGPTRGDADRARGRTRENTRGAGLSM